MSENIIKIIQWLGFSYLFSIVVFFLLYAVFNYVLNKVSILCELGFLESSHFVQAKSFEFEYLCCISGKCLKKSATCRFNSLSSRNSTNCPRIQWAVATEQHPCSVWCCRFKDLVGLFPEDLLVFIDMNTRGQHCNQNGNLLR